MTDIANYFHTDWAAMTFHDWLGLLITIAVFLALIALFTYVYHPANREKLESRRFMPINEDEHGGEDQS